MVEIFIMNVKKKVYVMFDVWQILLFFCNIIKVFFNFVNFFWYLFICRFFFFYFKVDVLIRVMKIEQKMLKNFCEYYEYGEYVLMKEWYDNL